MNKVVCRYLDGRVLKGATRDFSANKDHFHVDSIEKEEDTIDVEVPELKAVFFVKDHVGHEGYKDHLWVDNPRPGLKLVVEFLDGEIISGVTSGYSHDRPGFFITPLDPESNNERVYVIVKAVKKVRVGVEAEEFLTTLHE